MLRAARCTCLLAVFAAPPSPLATHAGAFRRERIYKPPLGNAADPTPPVVQPTPHDPHSRRVPMLHPPEHVVRTVVGRLPLCCQLRIPSCILLPCHPTALLPCHPTALPPCHPATLPPYRPATLPPCHPATRRLATLPCCRKVHTWFNEEVSNWTEAIVISKILARATRPTSTP